MVDRPPPLPSDRLSGWKEVAAYVGKSVRSAQRWEAELGLPVERLIGPDGGQIVQASRAAIDAWMRARTAEGVAADTGAGDEDEPAEDAGVSPAAEAPPSIEPAPIVVNAAPAPTATPWLRRAALPVAMLMLGLIAGAALAIVLMPVVATPTTFEVTGRQILAMTDSGRRLWSYEMPRPGSFAPLPGSDRPWQGDLDGDGTFELAFAVTYAEPMRVSADQSDEVFVFNRRGRLLFSVQPDLTLTRGTTTFGGPWRFQNAVYATGGGRLWLSYSDNTSSPGFVLEVTPDGKQRVRLVQDGPIKALEHWRPAKGEEYLLAGGTDMSSRLAWVTALDLHDQPARWPASSTTTCVGCPTRTPDISILLPRSELMTTLRRTSAQVFRLRAIRDRFTAEVDVGAGRFEMYWFDRRFELAGHRFLPQYNLAHREQERAGALTHPIDACPERRAPPDVRWWDATGGWIARQPPLRATNAPKD